MIMRNWFPICRGGLPLAVVAAAACSLAGCMSYGESVVYRLYQTNADRCAQNETDACVAMLQSSCEAPARLCTDYVPEFQAQASKQLSQKCRANDEAACQALDAVACDGGDAAVCDRLGERYAKLYASCKAGQRERLRVALTLSLAEKADRRRRQCVQERRLDRVPRRQLQRQRDESERRQERAVRDVLVPSMRRYAPVSA